MLDKGGGRIVNTASEAGLRGGTAGTPYTVSKHGVVGLTRSIAFFYGERGIRCNAVCPGGVETGIGVGSGMPHEAGLARGMAVVQGSAGRPSKPATNTSVGGLLGSRYINELNG